jgi:small-conductance mechanosensitive channel
MGLSTVSWSSIQAYVIPTAIVAIAVGIGIAYEFVARRRVEQHPLATKNAWFSIALESLGPSVSLWVVALGVYIAIATSAASPMLVHLLDQVLLVLVFASVTIVATRFVGGAVLRLSYGPGQQIASGTLFASVAQSLVAILGVLIILSSLGIQITPLLTALGVGGLAVALALQPPLANLFSGLQLVASRQIRPGDYVRLQTGQEGYVVDINWRSISIREPPNNLVVVPNLMLAQAIFTNYRLPEPRVATRVPLRVAYGSDLNFVERLALEAARRALDDVGAEALARDAYFRFEEFGDSTVNVSVNYFAPRVLDQERSQSAVLRHFYELLQLNGIGSPIQNPVHQHTVSATSRF